MGSGIAPDMTGGQRDTIAVLGTGIMGAPMARNLLRAGFGVHVYNRTLEKARARAVAAGHGDQDMAATYLSSVPSSSDR